MTWEKARAWNIPAEKSPAGKIPADEKSGGEKSGRGKFRRGKARRGKFRLRFFIYMHVSWIRFLVIDQIENYFILSVYVFFFFYKKILDN